jgi:hypothetical protein
MNVFIKRVLDGVSYEWNSFEDFIPDLVEIRKKDPAIYTRTIACGQGFNAAQRWWGANSYDDVQEKIRAGWPELRQKLERMMYGIELELPVYPTASTVRRRKRHRDDHGDSLDMGRVWNGQLDTAWERPVRTEKEATSTKRVTLAFDVTANASVSNDMAMWRAALCMLLVDSLAKAGRTLEVWVVDSTGTPFTWGGTTTFEGSTRKPERLWSAWCVKATADPINMDRLCAMCSVGFMRTAGFMAMGAGPWSANHSFGRALGYGLPYTLRERRAAGEIVVRIGQCYSRHEVLREYDLAWKEVEAAKGAAQAA